MTPFWEKKTLDEMTPAEWESLCDGCGKCCLLKFTHPDDGELYYTDVACRLLDCGGGACGDYKNRLDKVPECFVLTPDVVREGWLPPTCAYRRVDAGKPLYWWHHLISGDRETVHQAGMSVRGRVRYAEGDLDQGEIEMRRRQWPQEARPKH